MLVVGYFDSFNCYILNMSYIQNINKQLIQNDNMKKIILITLILLISFNIAVVSASDNATDVLNKTGDEKSFTDIQTQINKAKNNAEIDLNGNYSGAKQITISKSVTVVGHNNTVLDAKNTSRIFNVKSGDVTFKNLNFINGNATTGGAIYSKGNCIFINCTFKNNHAYNGGAIYSKGNLTVKNSVFDNNGGYGGAIDSSINLYKNVSKSNPANIKIQNSKFINNRGFVGGALKIDATAHGKVKNSLLKCAKISVKKCEFINNSAESSGGAISVALFFVGSFTLDKSNFINNSVTYDGSAIDLAGPRPFNIQNSNFIENNAKTAAICIYWGNTTIKNSTFSNNLGELVSCVHITGSTNLSLMDSKFNNNSKGSISIRESNLKIINGKSSVKYAKDIMLDDSFKSVKNIVVSAKDYVISYDSGELISFNVTNRYVKKTLDDYPVITYINNGKKTFELYRKTNSKGVIKFRLGYNYKVGKYTVTFGHYDVGQFVKKTVTLTIKKAKTTIKAPDVINKYGKSNYFKIKVTNKLSKKAVYNVKVKVKVFTGKKYKTYALETNSDGVAKLNTKNLKKGSHKVEIVSGNKNYIMSKKSSIKII